MSWQFQSIESQINRILFHFSNRSQFVQSLLLSTLSIIDASDGDEQTNAPENEASDPEQISGDGTATTAMSFDPVTMNASMAARASNYDDAKKKQESASHSDLDSSHPQHLSGEHFYFFLFFLSVRIWASQKLTKKKKKIQISAPHAQQRSSSKPKTGSSKSNQPPANPQTTKPAREKPVPMPNDTR